MPPSEALEFTMDLSFVDSGKREIQGVAHVPVVDNENEIVLKAAIDNAIAFFMKLPVLHLQHSERPIGMVNEARVVDGKLFVKGTLKDTPDTDDVWEMVKSGKLNKFSIYGRRLIASPECSVPPHKRVQPCITEKIYLDSISVVGDNAHNPATFLEAIMKAYTDDSYAATLPHQEHVGTQAVQTGYRDYPPGSLASNQAAMSVATTQNTDSAGWTQTGNPGVPTIDSSPQAGGTSGAEQVPVKKMCKCNEPVEKGESPSVEERLAAIEKILAKLVESDKKVHATMEKAMSDTETKKDSGKTEPAPVVNNTVIQKAPEPEKAEPEKPAFDAELVKAELAKATQAQVTELIKAQNEMISGFQKATAEQIDGLKKIITEQGAVIDSMKKNVIQKGGSVVIIPGETDISPSSPVLQNLEQLRKAGKV